MCIPNQDKIYRRFLRSFDLESNEEIKNPKSCARLILNEMENALSTSCSSKQSPSQLSLNDMLLTYYKNIDRKSEKSSSTNGKPRSLFVPSHSLKEIESLEWPNLQFVNQLDVIYNTNEDCENLEGLFRRYVETFVLVETLSSYNSGKCGSLKKRVEQLK